MTRARQDRALAILIRSGGWITASALADQLGVTARSVRSYITAVNARVPGPDAIESGPLGYRAGASAGDALRIDGDASAPRDRLYRIIRALLDSEDGLDVHDLAGELFVSEATIDADLVRVRGLLQGTGLTLQRVASRARLRGSEREQRRLLSRLLHEEIDDGAFELGALRRVLGDGAVSTATLSELTARISAGLAELGYRTNAYSIGDVVLHIAIAAGRVRQGHAIRASGEQGEVTNPAISELVRAAARETLAVELDEGEVRHLATLVETRVVVPGVDAGHAPRDVLDSELVAAVHAVVRRAADEFLIDLDDDDFVRRLSLHVQNLRRRAREGAFSRNATARSLKVSYPLLFDVAVYLSNGLRDVIGGDLTDDEISYLAMHVGGQVERTRTTQDAITATVVSPGYYELPDTLRTNLQRALGATVRVTAVETRADPDWSAFDTDLVVTTIEPAGVDDRYVRIQPFLTDLDVDRVNAAAARARRSRRLARLRGELARYFSADAFFPGLSDAASVDDLIGQLGAPLVAAGVIDDDYLARTRDRERLSSTAFTDSLAVPHAIGMTATRTAISVGIAPGGVEWGDDRVNIIALVAFSESDRSAFQTVFEQLVEVFSERENAQRIVRRGTTFTAFLDELVAIVDG